MALMLALSRNIANANQSMKEGQWRRSAFMGIEVRNKTLGIAGLGRVGTEVARRAKSFGMRLLGYDPFLAPDHAAQIGVELVDLEEMLAQSDFVTLHTPLTDGTREMIGAEQLALIKPGARIINVARGELIDEAALLEALDGDRLAAVALDVFAQEPPVDSRLPRHQKVLVTPHLGASTEEAQREVAVEAAEQVLAVLSGQPARNTVNAPFVSPEVHAVVAPYLKVGSVVGKLLTFLAEGQFMGLTIRYEGEIAQHETPIMKSAVLAGLLRARVRRSGEPNQLPLAGGATGVERHGTAQPDSPGIRQHPHGDFTHQPGRRDSGGDLNAGRAPHCPGKQLLAGHDTHGALPALRGK